MSRACTACASDRRQEIDEMLVAGKPIREIAKLVAIGPDAVWRHKAEHIPAKLAKAQEAAEIADADSLLASIAEIVANARRLAARAEAEGDWRTAGTLLVRELTRVAELQAKLRGEIQTGTKVQVNLIPPHLLRAAESIARMSPEEKDEFLRIEGGA